MRDLRIPFFTVLFIFFGLFLYTKALGPIPFSVNSVTTAKSATFDVSGTGEVTAIPDTALITVGVEKRNNSVQAAKDEVNNIINKITEDIKGLGVNVKDIKTTNYSVNPQYDYTSGTNRITGYSVNASLEVRLQPIDKANSAVDVATRDGATQVNSVQFVLDEKVQKDLEKQARQKAIKDAKEKAQSISADSGMHLGKIVNVSENFTSPMRPLPYVMNAAKLDMAEGREAAPPTDLQPGENKITSTVTVSYETY